MECRGVASRVDATRHGAALGLVHRCTPRVPIQSKTTTGPAPGSRVAVVSGCPLSSHPGLTGGGARGRAAFALCLRRRVARGRRVTRRRTGLVVQNLVGRRGCFRGAAGSWDCGWKPRFAPGHARGDSPQAQQHHAQAQGASRARHQLWPNSTGGAPSASPQATGKLYRSTLKL